MKQEIWTDIKGYEGYYQVSNLGRIRALFPYKGQDAPRILKNVIGPKRKQPVVFLKFNGKTESCPIYRLVAISFVDGFVEGCSIKHKDGNVQNCRADNLICLETEAVKDLQGEEWRSVLGYEGFYEVSNLGRVRSLNYRRRKEIQLRELVLSTSGYYEVVLSNGISLKHHRVHRLVAMAFVDGYEEGLYVNHKDENKLNNRADNLEWISQIENNAYGTVRERQAATIHAKLSRLVERIDEKGLVIASYKSQSAAARSMGYTIERIKGYCQKGIDGWRYVGDKRITTIKTAKYVLPKEMDSSAEEWRNVVGFEGHYMISSKGRVKSLSHPRWTGYNYHMTKEKILAPRPQNGYVFVELYKDGKCTRKPVHRLVAEAYVPNDNPLRNVVNHINEDGTDNRVINLEWVTQKENLNYGTCNKRQGEARRRNGVERRILDERNNNGSYGAEKPVLCIDLDGCIVAEYQSISIASRALKLSSSHISACCKGKCLSVGGYHWQYIDVERKGNS